jgi:hypothetical protein
MLYQAESPAAHIIDAVSRSAPDDPVPGVLTDAMLPEIAKLSEEQRALLELRLRRARGTGRRTRAATPMPLSFTQGQLWFLHRPEPGTPV